MLDIANYCGCGAVARYTIFDSERKEVGSCNKYGRCKSYNDLKREAAHYEQLFVSAVETAKALSLYKDGTEQYNYALKNLDILESRL